MLWAFFTLFHTLLFKSTLTSASSNTTNEVYTFTFTDEEAENVAGLVEFSYLLNNALTPDVGSPQSSRMERVKQSLFGQLIAGKVDPEEFSEEEILFEKLPEEKEVKKEEEAPPAASEESRMNALKVYVTFTVIFLVSLIFLTISLFISFKKPGFKSSPKQA